MAVAADLLAVTGPLAVLEFTGAAVATIEVAAATIEVAAATIAAAATIVAVMAVMAIVAMAGVASALDWRGPIITGRLLRLSVLLRQLRLSLCPNTHFVQ